jgi:hypothetical protein
MPRYGMYNDPAMAQSFENIAKMFAPPSAQDAYAAAKAAEVQQKMGALAQMYAAVSDPNVTRDQFDRAGIATNLFAPNQSYYAVDQNNATDLKKNSADNTRQLQQTAMQQQGETGRALLTPVSAGATRFVPPDIASLYKVDPTQIGVVNVNPGDKAVLPGGREIQGNPKPLSETEVKGGIISGLTPAEQRAVAIGNTPIQEVVDPVTKKPTIKFQADSINMQPAAKPSEMSDISKLIAERDSLPAGDPNRAAYDARIAALGRGQQQSAYDKAADKQFADLNESIFNAAKESYGNRDMMKAALSYIKDPTVNQGAAGQANLVLRKYLNAFGVEAGDTSPAEMLSNLGNRIALQLRNPDGGAGMPGSLSDSDRAFLQNMSLSLGNSPGANEKIATAYLAMQNRNIDLEDLRRKYITEHGRLDEGFRGQVGDYLSAHDLYQGVRSAPPQAPAAVDPIEAELQRRAAEAKGAQ